MATRKVVLQSLAYAPVVDHIMVEATIILWGATSSYGCDNEFTDCFPPQEVSIDAAVASVISEVRNRFLVRIWFTNWHGLQHSPSVDLIGWSQPVIDGDRQMVRPITCQVFFPEMWPPFSKQFLAARFQIGFLVYSVEGSELVPFVTCLCLIGRLTAD